mmetsp:Transcript_12221/g.36993  ORF Transcript_12221/g.36993 Transcript_12221/m.36993 type:complete len:293 (-) Transcript_12221:29-907(-)|eukprot:CAMPEP_0177649852 /NCGR_PEP_ID=MMETSP0447-20121125/11618_1 /TAXON_ID=0 /ORGANISM="Stygamoeba regulata, Strain BSH-02190019" /LENGTH=292 /DNA_ID=CAMNT_0019152659 /DNA_START=79 /DNA_END=957 /DNA_ORIENTATION=-
MLVLLDSYYLAITALATGFYQLVFFLIAAFFKFDKVTDLAGGTNFGLLALLTLFLGQSYYARQLVLSAFVCLWALRLSGFLFTRIILWGEDHRFDEMRDKPFRFAMFWIIQAIWVWVGMLPVTVVNSRTDRDPDLNAADYVGWIMFFCGLALEAVADIQKLFHKRQQRQDPGSEAHWCDVGVWRWSRHPNYFGEILLWWGIFASAANVLQDGEWAVVAGPLLITSLLLGLSGMPILEASSDRRYGVDPAYWDYKAATSPLIPLPRWFYVRVPNLLKALFFFEFPCYTHRQEE